MVRLPDDAALPGAEHDERLPQPGDEVLVYYAELGGVLGIVRSVLDARDGLISVRIPFRNMPAEHRSKWVSEPGNPTMAPIVLQRGEYRLFKRGGFSAPFRHPGETT